MNLIQVVNPYLAYLDFAKFYAGNSTIINNGYYIWDGDINNSFTTINSDGNRYRMTTTPTIGNPGLIPPLQSFIVSKMNGSTAHVASLTMSASYTTTSAGAYTDYTLRSTQVTSGGILHIKASQGNKTSYAALVYDPEASPARGNEDMPVLIYDDIPLTVYSLTTLHEPLSINANNLFQSVDLGLRVKEAGEMKLEFIDLPTFGYNVTLLDKQLNKETDLQKTPEYTFTVAKSGTNASELNDRFTLRMEYTGKGVITGAEPIETPALHVSSANGYAYIQSSAGIISSLQIYNVSGALVYSSSTPADRFRIALATSQMYIIKAKIESEFKVEKIVVK
jgi:hypothetical protein